MTSSITQKHARSLWMQAQGLDQLTPFGLGPKATVKAIEHLGYVQIDTISVIERCHHHILHSRIPDYKTAHLAEAQSINKSVFEYWTHALAYVPTKDFQYFKPTMLRQESNPSDWYGVPDPKEYKKVLALIKKQGALTIRDIKDDILVEKDHEWASRKPSKKLLQSAFNCGHLVISERQGMLKKYELTNRHFNWKKSPKAATEKQVLEYKLNRSLRSQSIVSLDSICHLSPKQKPATLKLIETLVKKKELMPVQFGEAKGISHWVRPNELEKKEMTLSERIHILSPFDPLIIQRKRLNLFFNYNHLFEAYIPKEKRIYGYFSLPVLKGDQVVAVLDLKTDRAAKKLKIQQWNWIPKQKSLATKKLIEAQLHLFERFQLGK